MSIIIQSYNNLYPYYGDGTYESPYSWDFYTDDSGAISIEFTCSQRGTVYVACTSNNGDSIRFNRIIVFGDERLLFDGDNFETFLNSNSTTTYTIKIAEYINDNAFFQPLYIWFEPEYETSTTSTTPAPTTTVAPSVFIHVGDITVSDDYCGRFELTGSGDTEFLRIYGRRIYLINYPSTTGTYDLTVCAEDLADRFTPVCDTFSIDIDYCEFTTTLPPTTTTSTTTSTTTTSTTTTSTTTTSTTTTSTTTTSTTTTTTTSTTTEGPTTTTSTTTEGPTTTSGPTTTGQPTTTTTTTSTTTSTTTAQPGGCLDNYCAFSAEQDSGGSWYWVQVYDGCSSLNDCACPTPVTPPEGPGYITPSCMIIYAQSEENPLP